MLNKRLRKALYGVGINDSDYVTQPSKGKRCPHFDRWHSMIRRCYSENSLRRNPRYEFVTVDQEWLVFSKFLAWSKEQKWEGKVLDKDLKGDGLIYSKSNCLPVSHQVNSFISEKTNGTLYGTRLKFQDGRVNCWVSQIYSNGKKKHLGVFPDEKSAHRAWQKQKIEDLCVLIDLEEDFRVKSELVLILKQLEFQYEHNLVTEIINGKANMV